MRYFNNFELMSEKRDVQGRQRFVARFVSGPHNRLKTLSAAVKATRSAIRILLRGSRVLEPNVNFSAQNLSNLGQCRRYARARRGCAPPNGCL